MRGIGQVDPGFEFGRVLQVGQQLFARSAVRLRDQRDKPFVAIISGRCECGQFRALRILSRHDGLYRVATSEDFLRVDGLSV